MKVRFPKKTQNEIYIEENPTEAPKSAVPSEINMTLLREYQEDIESVGDVNQQFYSNQEPV